MSAAKPKAQAAQLHSATYRNPVFEPVLADPTVVQHGGCFYTYGTEDYWGREGGYHLVPVTRSPDLIHWTLAGDALTTKPDWKAKGGIRAPDVSAVIDQICTILFLFRATRIRALA